MEKFKNYIPIIVVVVLAIILVAGSSIYMKNANLSGKQLSKDEIGVKVTDFINTSILKGRATADLVSAESAGNGLFKIKFKISDQEIESYATSDGKLFFPEAIDMTAATTTPAQQQGITIGNFAISSEAVITEDGKPVIYFFGADTCPHCKWEHPIVQKVMNLFKDQVIFHDNMNGTDKDQDVFGRFSDGGIPTTVLAGKYYKVGSGEAATGQSDADAQAQEEKVLTALVCKLTNSQPQGVCDSVKDLVSQITE